MGEAQRAKLWREASALLGTAAGIESDPYGLANHQGIEPAVDKADYLDWARAAHRRHTFRPFSGDATIWKHHARGLSAREIGPLVGLDFGTVARRLKRIEAEIRETERRRRERPRTLTGLVTEADPLLLVQILKAAADG